MDISFQSLDEKLSTNSFYVFKGNLNDRHLSINSFSGKEVPIKPGCFLSRAHLQSFFKKRVLPKTHLFISGLGEKLFKCSCCNNNFFSPTEVNYHERGECMKPILEEQLKCKECHKTFKRRSRLIEHLRVHTKEKPYKCDACGKCFSSRSGQMSHLLSHTDEKDFECDVCFKTFKWRSKLNLHYNVHTNAKPYECEICHKQFLMPQRLKLHYRIHTGEKPYECGTCGRHFRKFSMRSRHERTHLKKEK